MSIISCPSRYTKYPLISKAIANKSYNEEQFNIFLKEHTIIIIDAKLDKFALVAKLLPCQL